MKKLLKRPAALAVLLLVLYLFGLVIGTLAISIYPIDRQKQYFINRAQDIAAEYVEGVDTSLHKIIGANMYIFIYAADGTLLRYIPSNSADPNAVPVISLEQKLAPVLEGKTLFRPAIAQIKQSYYNSILVVTGAPIYDDGQVIGAVFLAKNLMDLPEAIIGYLCYFTLFYWLSVYFIVSSIRKNRKLEQLQQNYIANITHALKSPIASVKTLTETLCDVENIDVNKQRTYYGLILQEMNLQGHMVQEILELSKLQSRERDLTKARCGVSECFSEVLDKYAMLCECARIEFAVSDRLFSLPPLYTNASCVSQVLEILLENALKYSQSGDRIEVTAETSKNLVTFCVRDTGAGISPQDLPHVFERFYRCSRNKNGNGLGLAIAWELIAGMKEKIWAESELGTGTAFYFTVHLK